jgi:hypothetical protein
MRTEQWSRRCPQMSWVAVSSHAASDTGNIYSLNSEQVYVESGRSSAVRLMLAGTWSVYWEKIIVSETMLMAQWCSNGDNAIEGSRFQRSFPRMQPYGVRCLFLEASASIRSTVSIPWSRCIQLSYQDKPSDQSAVVGAADNSGSRLMDRALC